MSRDHGQCLADETLTEYLEGSLDPAIRAVSEVHLIGCNECRNQLAFFMRVLRQDVTAEEATALEAVEARWHHQKGSRNLSPAQSQAEPIERSLWASRSLAALAAVAAVLVIGLLSIWMVRERSAEPKTASEVVRLLLGQSRPFESRLADQPHRPIVRTRGSDDAGVSYNLLAGEMTRLSATSHEMGRFYLLQKDFNRSIPYLEIAEQEVGASAAVHNDLGVAYLENGDASLLMKAGEEFQHALQEDQSFSEAAFNLALFYERTNANSRAEAQWKQFLEMDAKSEWAREARGRLQGLNR